MLEVQSAAQVLQLIAERLRPLGADERPLPLAQAVGRVSAAALFSAEDIPAFDRSTVDGYALRAADSYGCSEALPARFKLLGAVEMGADSAYAVGEGEAVYVPTGGVIPAGCDAAAMLEYAEEPGDGYVYIRKPVAPGNNLIYRGDDISAGAMLLPAHTRLHAHHIGLLAAAGITELDCLRLPRVAIISSGDELIPPGEQPAIGQIRDVNSHFLAAALRARGIEAKLCGIVRDDYQALLQASAQALAKADMLLISGGSSVGVKDNTARVIEALPGMRLLVHGVAVKPGKPTLLGVSDDNKIVFGLPGHPLSAYFIYLLFVEAALARLSGAPAVPPARRTARMAVNYPSNSGREEYVPVTLSDVDGQLTARPIFAKSGLIGLLSAADGYIRISREQEGAAKGQAVEVTLF
ncbi:MAG: molybdopterin-binding protein [Bacillota bacterium]|nr:molybdopterin-binding protein [Bacillota bacterium]